MEMYIRIRRARKKIGYSKSEVVRQIEVSNSAYFGWELPPSHRNATRPSVTNLTKLAMIFNVRLEWLATGRGEMQTPTQLTPIVRMPSRSKSSGASLLPLSGESLLQKHLVESYRALSAEKRQALLQLFSLIG